MKFGMKPDLSVAVAFRPAVVAPGDDLDVELCLESDRFFSFDRLTVTLRCVEHSKLTEGVMSSTRCRVALTARLPAERLRAGEDCYRARFSLPPTLPASYTGRWWKVYWELLVDIERSSWLLLHRRFVVVVAPPSVLLPCGDHDFSVRVFCSNNNDSHGALPRAECTLDTLVSHPGGVLSGRLALRDINSIFARSVKSFELSLISAEHSVRDPDPPRYEVSRCTVSLSKETQQRLLDGASVSFELPLPSDLSPCLTGELGALRWSLELSACYGIFSRRPLLSFPIELRARPRPSSTLSQTALLPEASLLRLVAARHALDHDPATHALSAHTDWVSLSITFTVVHHSARAVLNFSWRSLDLGLNTPDVSLALSHSGHPFRAQPFTEMKSTRTTERDALGSQAFIAFISPLRRAPWPNTTLASIGDSGAELTRDARFDQPSLESLFTDAQKFLDAFTVAISAVHAHFETEPQR